MPVDKIASEPIAENQDSEKSESMINAQFIKEQAVKIIENELLVYSLNNDEDQTSSMSFPTCFLYADTFLRSLNKTDGEDISAAPGDTVMNSNTKQKRTPSLWVGTNNGRVFIYELEWSMNAGPVKVSLRSDLQLRHHAKVLALCILDASSQYTPIDQGEHIRYDNMLEIFIL